MFSNRRMDNEHSEWLLPWSLFFVPHDLYLQSPKIYQLFKYTFMLRHGSKIYENHYLKFT